MVDHPHIFWLSLGGLMLAAEMLGGNGYLVWSGVAAVITGLVVWLVPLGWEWQGVMFAILTLLAAWLWWKWLSRRVREQKHSDSHLNQRMPLEASSLMGSIAGIAELVKDSANKRTQP